VNLIVDNRLDYLDQASFLSMRATGREQCVQLVWIYEHPVDMDAIRRFHAAFGYGLAGRRIERSPLPFGRHRWVSALGPPAPLDVATTPRPRSELSDWLDERSQVPVDPEWGPSWHLGVLPLTDGSTAVTAVGSHCLGDGTAGLMRAFEAVHGQRPDPGYPPPRSRTWRAGVAEDLRGTLRDLPEVGRALRGTAKLIVEQRKSSKSAEVSAETRRPVPKPAPQAYRDGVVLPVVNLAVDLADWDARAAALGGNGYALLAGLGTRLGERMGRVNPETSAVMLLIALSERGPDDTRAHAMSFVNVHVDPSAVRTDLTAARSVIKQALTTQRETPDEKFSLLALSPFMPKRAVRSAGGLAFGFNDLPVSCSNMGDLPDDIARVDGTMAEYVFLRGVDQNVTRADMELSEGQLVLVGGRIGGSMSISIVGYECGAQNTKAWLREQVAATLAEFDLTGTLI